MIRRSFLKRALGAAALALAGLYVPGRPWAVVVPKLPNFSLDGGRLIPEYLIEALKQLERDGILYSPGAFSHWPRLTANW